eukprot:TRINITY_DN2826_c0_g1_i1.p1 TRINITY_DN2826_c0_g1~~TRINITY_DN2826_c0_g1_i1.p1  ORF type:complete len:244 (+),score=62.69 TRINITY_DN2826_c0_g1_i1:54-734(+)
MASEEIRKCVWNFKRHVAVWRQLRIEAHGLIDLYPIVSYFFPELTPRACEDADGFPCPRNVAERLCPQGWSKQDDQSCATPNWGLRPLTQDMIHRAGNVGVGSLLEIRKGVRTELSARVNEKMSEVSETYHATGVICSTANRDLATLLSTDLTTPFPFADESATDISPFNDDFFRKIDFGLDDEQDVPAGGPVGSREGRLPVYAAMHDTPSPDRGVSGLSWMSSLP